MGGVVVIDTSGAQDWIIAGATELKVIRGGSLLLDQAFRQAEQSLIVEFGPPVAPDLAGGAAGPPPSGWWAPVVASGSMTLIFAEHAQAVRAAGQLERALAASLPRLPLRVSSGEFPLPDPHPELNAFQAAVREARAASDPQTSASASLQAYTSGTVPCTTCGAGSVAGPSAWCPGCAARTAAVPPHDNGDVPGADVTYQTQKIGRATLSRRYVGYLGVICADGNNVGQRFHDADQPQTLAKLSKTIQECTRGAVRAAVTAAVRARDGASPMPPMPYNPVIMAGDDVCLVVPADRALAAASAMCLADEALPMSAGVLLCHDTFPFAAAHDHAERLLGSAKAAGRDHPDGAGAAYVAFALETGSSAREQLTDQPMSASPYPATAISELLRVGRALTATNHQLKRLEQGLLTGGRVAERAWAIFLHQAVTGGEADAIRGLLRRIDLAWTEGPWVRGRHCLAGDLSLVRALEHAR